MSGERDEFADYSVPPRYWAELVRSGVIPENATKAKDPTWGTAQGVVLTGTHDPCGKTSCRINHEGALCDCTGVCRCQGRAPSLRGNGRKVLPTHCAACGIFLYWSVMDSDEFVCRCGAVTRFEYPKELKR